MPAMRVLISGAGIAGPTLAFWLAKAGARITVLEKNPALLSNGQNVDIQDTALTVIEKMGLLDEVRRLNTTEKGTQFIDTKGRPFAPFPVPSKERPRAIDLTSEYEILRGDLAKVLHGATKDLPDVNYMLGTTIKQVITNDDNTVKVELSNGEVQEYDLLVAADGQWSRVRKQCFPPESVKVVHTGMYIVYFTIPRLPEDDDWWNVYQALGSRLITLRPDPHGTIRAMFSLMPSNEAQETAWMEAGKSDRQTQEALVRQEFADAGWQAQRLLNDMESADDYYFQVVQQIKMPTWSSSRVVCLGDTAHAPSPLTGWGTSLAIMGGYVLAGELSKLGEGEGPAAALEAYEKAFRPFVNEVQQIPPFVPGVAHPGTAWKRWIFGTSMAALSRVMDVPWIAASVAWFSGRFIGESYHEHFPLPQYPRFDETKEA